jgi:hypothetical protein
MILPLLLINRLIFIKITFYSIKKVIPSEAVSEHTAVNTETHYHVRGCKSPPVRYVMLFVALSCRHNPHQRKTLSGSYRCVLQM